VRQVESWTAVAHGGNHGAQCAEPASAPAPPQDRTASAPRRVETAEPEGNFELFKCVIAYNQLPTSTNGAQ
jgi:hypothetical protein